MVPWTILIGTWFISTVLKGKAPFSRETLLVANKDTSMHAFPLTQSIIYALAAFVVLGGIKLF